MKINREPVKTSIRPREFFRSTDLINRFREEVYRKTQIAFRAGVRINDGTLVTKEIDRNDISSSNVCDVANDIATRELVYDGIPARLLQQVPGGILIHQFVDVPQEGSEEPNHIVDLAYKQFVPEDEREGLPDMMVIAYTSPQDIVYSLTAHHIPEFKHDIWLAPILGTTWLPEIASMVERNVLSNMDLTLV